MAATAERMEDTVVCSSDAAAADPEPSKVAVTEVNECPPEPSKEAVTEVNECPKGHRLTIARVPAGSCDGCTSRVPEGQLVSSCSDCNWYLCTTCSPITRCPEGHELHLGAAVQGRCDGCG